MRKWKEGHPMAHFSKRCKITIKYNNNYHKIKIMGFEYFKCAKKYSHFPSELGCFPFSSFLASLEQVKKIEMLKIIKLQIIY